MEKNYHHQFLYNSDNNDNDNDNNNNINNNTNNNINNNTNDNINNDNNNDNEAANISSDSAFPVYQMCGNFNSFYNEINNSTDNSDRPVLTNKRDNSTGNEANIQNNTNQLNDGDSINNENSSFDQSKNKSNAKVRHHSLLCNVCTAIFFNVFYFFKNFSSTKIYASFI